MTISSGLWNSLCSPSMKAGVLPGPDHHPHAGRRAQAEGGPAVRVADAGRSEGGRLPTDAALRFRWARRRDEQPQGDAVRGGRIQPRLQPDQGRTVICLYYVVASCDRADGD